MKSNDYDKITLIYEPQQVIRRNQRSIVLNLVIILLITGGFTLILFSLYGLSLHSKNIQSNRPKPVRFIHPGCPVKPFDYLQLTVTWPATFCYFNTCVKNVTNEWGLHGLWPNYWKGYPEFCCPTWPFNDTEVQDLMPQLNAKWFNLCQDSTEDNFLAHEWNKHGTCSSQSTQLDSQHKYFASGLNLYDKYPVHQWLLDAGISPDPSRTYKLEDVQAVLVKNYPNQVTIECSSYKVNGKEHSLLYVVDFCMDKQLNPIDCPSNVRDCKNILYYPQPNQAFSPETIG